MRWHEPNLSIFHLESARARRVHGRTGCVERLKDLSLSYLSPHSAGLSGGSGVRILQDHSRRHRYFPAVLASRCPREQPQDQTDFVCAVRLRPGTRPAVAPWPATLAHVAPCSRGWPRLRPARRYATRPNVGNRGRTPVSPYPHLQGGNRHEDRTAPAR
jgi:hypothetical protein